MRVVKRVLKEYTEANEQKALQMLEEHGNYRTLLF